MAIGDQLLDLLELGDAGLLGDPESDLVLSLQVDHLNLLMAQGNEAVSTLRRRLVSILRHDSPELRDRRDLRESAMMPAAGAKWLLPARIGDYTDFYASIDHASNVGAMFRPDAPLLPNYKWIPIGYHGRASSIVAGGTPIRRPRGQTRPREDQPPVFGPCAMLDYELELGAFIAGSNAMGEHVSIGRAEDRLFGICLVNDWSARDMQKWEYQPLGPFLAKNFATSVSPFVVTMEAIAPFRTAARARPSSDPQPLSYLLDEDDQARGGIDLMLEVWMQSAAMREAGTPPVKLSSVNFDRMYWTLAQMVTHHTSGGCNLEPGDLIASGTVSGTDRGSRGCMLELTWNGPGADPARSPITLPTGEQRTFLADGDEVILRGYAHREGFRRIGLGECRGLVLPARD